MKIKEQTFLIERLTSILDNVSRTPVDCGVKRRAMVSLGELIELAKTNKLKAPPKPPERPLDDRMFKMLKDLRGFVRDNTKAKKDLEKKIRHQVYLRRKA